MDWVILKRCVSHTPKEK